MAGQNRSFNLPWHQYDTYWIVVGAKSGRLPAELMQGLKTAGLSASGDFMQIKTAKAWKQAWEGVHRLLLDTQAMETVQVAVTHGDTPPSTQVILDWRAPVQIQLIAESLWLGEALLEDRILCYLQPVVSGRDKVFGYESFARAQSADGSVISGDKIMLASRALGIEFMIDRHLHVQAITTFVCSDFDGFLFVNLSPGFIQRPAIYLEGLSETAKNFGMISKHVVLDFTRSESPHDIAHLRGICEYGRSRGYSIALDDIASLDGAKKLMNDIHPDFVKLDMKLCRQAEEPAKRETISRIVELAHGMGATVIAEGVETEAMHLALKNLGVDLFQGYFFSPPVPVEAIMKRNTAAN